ncbi:hypothetical protein ACIQ2D_03255 [Lysinibacillus sp. NPDC097287]|uniref:hypothetical protein n=1 Tax=Lysinibacillus sp. NPDC097287 TaxID=3364144 RepID=UPI003826EA32
MKKLFQLTPLIELSQYETLKIIGPYRFLHADASSCSFIYANYKVTIRGKSVEIDAIKDEMLQLTVVDLKEMHIKIRQEEDRNNDMES